MKNHTDLFSIICHTLGRIGKKCPMRWFQFSDKESSSKISTIVIITRSLTFCYEVPVSNTSTLCSQCYDVSKTYLKSDNMIFNVGPNTMLMSCSWARQKKTANEPNRNGKRNISLNKGIFPLSTIFKAKQQKNVMTTSKSVVHVLYP